MVGRLRGSGKVSVVGAGNVGATLAQRIVEKGLADVVLLDIIAGKPQGIALDLMEARGVEGDARQIIGTNDYRDTAGSDLVVITAGFARRPGMSRDDLLVTNARIVAAVTREIICYSPETVLLVVTNPLDAMTYLAWRVSGLPKPRVVGMAGVLDAARFKTFIAWELGVSVRDITALVLGGHGDVMVPLPRFSTVSGIPLTQLLTERQIERLIERTRDGGAEVVRLLKSGGAYYAPASAAAQMVSAIMLDEQRILPAAAHLDGEYGLKDIFIGVPVRLGSGGVEQVVALELEVQEKAALHQSAATIRDNLERIAQLFLY